MSSASDGPDTGPVSLATWAGFAAMCIGMFMAILDVQIVATSLPDIQQALSIAPEQMSWVQTAYLIAEVIAIPLTGLLMRALTMRWLFVGATSVFTLASVGCAASDSFGSLIAWRVLQGFAGGTLIPAVFAAVFLLFPLRAAGHLHDDCRGAGGAGPDRRTHRRRLDNLILFLALPVPDQRAAGPCRRGVRRDVLAARCRKALRGAGA